MTTPEPVLTFLEVVAAAALVVEEVPVVFVPAAAVVVATAWLDEEPVLLATAELIA